MPRRQEWTCESFGHKVSSGVKSMNETRYYTSTSMNMTLGGEAIPATGPYRDCVPPVDHELNLTMQAILTNVSWGLTAVLLVIAIGLGVRERTPFYALMVLAAAVGAFAEPLYDVAMML